MSEAGTRRLMLQNAVVQQIVHSVWPEAAAMTAAKQSRYYGDVRDILDGFPVPCVSRADRERVAAAYEALTRDAR
jgi:hypothetical protein